MAYFIHSIFYTVFNTAYQCYLFYYYDYYLISIRKLIIITFSRILWCYKCIIYYAGCIYIIALLQVYNVDFSNPRSTLRYNRTIYQFKEFM